MIKRFVMLFPIVGIALQLNSFNYRKSDPGVLASVSNDYCLDFYQALQDQDIDYNCFKTAITGFQTLIENEKDINRNLLTVIDYTKPSTEKRLFVIDIEKKEVLIKTLVSHGKNSGLNYATAFSNKIHSYMSSIGFYLTGTTYTGRHGYSLRLEGLENEYNSNAYKRAIVIHPANYVSDDYIRKYGRIGRSYGCPALPPKENDRIINLIKQKTCLFIYYPDDKYLASSGFLNENRNLSVK